MRCGVDSPERKPYFRLDRTASRRAWSTGFDCISEMVLQISFSTPVTSVGSFTMLKTLHNPGSRL